MNDIQTNNNDSLDKPIILIIDDEIDILKILKDSLEDEEYQVHTLADPTKALDLIGQLIPDLILLDISMPNINGINLLEQIKREYPQQEVMIISGHGTIQIALDALKKGAHDFIEKPLNLDTICEKINFLKKDPSKETNEKTISPTTNYKQQGIIGESNLFIELMQQVDKLLNLTCPLLIYGKSGTGKTIVAQYVHQQISHDHQALVTFDCGTQHDADFEALIKETHARTIFLKNIHLLDHVLQKKLLAFMIHIENSPLRLIASSDNTLFTRLQKGLFLEGLFHRLHATPIEIPALNKRSHDIPLLIEHLTHELEKSTNKKLVFTNTSLRIMRNHLWHDNIRGLKTFLEHLATATDDDHCIITPELLEQHLPEKSIQFIPEQSFVSFGSLDEAQKTFEKKFLTYVLKKNRYNVEHVAAQLALEPTELKEKLVKLNLGMK